MKKLGTGGGSNKLVSPSVRTGTGSKGSYSRRCRSTRSINSISKGSS